MVNLRALQTSKLFKINAFLLYNAFFLFKFFLQEGIHVVLTHRISPRGTGTTHMQIEKLPSI